MGAPRLFTDLQCAELAAWDRERRQVGTVSDKCKELKISRHALYDAIARGNKLPTAGARFKLRNYVLENSGNGFSIEADVDVPRESTQSEPDEH